MLYCCCCFSISIQWSPIFGILEKADKQINNYSAMWLKNKLNWGWESTVVRLRKASQGNDSRAKVYQVGKTQPGKRREEWHSKQRDWNPVGKEAGGRSVS